MANFPVRFLYGYHFGQTGPIARRAVAGGGAPFAALLELPVARAPPGGGRGGAGLGAGSGASLGASGADGE